MFLRTILVGAAFAALSFGQNAPGPTSTPATAPTVSSLPTDAFFTGISFGARPYPMFGYAHLLTSSAGGVYTYSQDILTSVKVKPFAITNNSQSGVMTPAKLFPKIRFSIWMFGAPGVATTSTNWGLSWAYGGFVLWAPMKKHPEWKVTGGYQEVASTISPSEHAGFLAVAYTSK